MLSHLTIPSIRKLNPVKLQPPISVQQRAKYLFSDVAVLFNYYKLGTPVVPTKYVNYY